MYKYKKKTIKILTLFYILLSIIEFIKYFFINSNLFGLIYMLLTLIIIFLLVPVSYNYNRYYSVPRISKLIMIIIFGIFNSYLLYNIIVKNMSYIDASIDFNKSIFIYKNIFKGIVYFLLFIFTIFEFKLDKLLKSIKNDDNKSNTLRPNKNYKHK